MKVYIVVLVCASVLSLRSAGAVSPEDARIIAAVSTWTQLSFVTTTTTIPYTCKLAINTPVCKKRSLRHSKAVPGTKFGNIAGLDSSMITDDAVGDLFGNQPVRSSSAGIDRQGKLALTVWSSATSTYTMLMTSTNLAVTFSVSYYCTVLGGNYPPNCAGLALMNTGTLMYTGTGDRFYLADEGGIYYN